MTAKREHFLDELGWRDREFQCTSEPALREHLADPAGTPRRAYCGFDPTADSLTIGNLVPIMALIRFARAGHQPVVVMGGGTGLIGDPSGKSAERQLLTEEKVAANVASQRDIFDRCFAGAGLDPLPADRVVNNHDWLGGLGYIDVLRDVGKHFRVNEMVKRDNVRDRLDREQGISYTEFSYMILQAYDFVRLYQDAGVTLQLGGSDQYGNIVSGVDLIRKLAATGDDHAKSFGLTVPLVTKADGTKFGKTESGAVWLTAPKAGDTDDDLTRRTSPYAYFQFWLNASDDDVGSFLKTFTLIERAEFDDLMAAHAEAPGKREAQRVLARLATAIVHGSGAAATAEAAGQALFSGDLASLDEPTLREVFASVPASDHAAATLAGDGADPVEVLIATGLAKSKREAREFLSSGSVSINGDKIGPDDRLTAARLLHGSLMAIRRGKKNWHLTRWG